MDNYYYDHQFRGSQDSISSINSYKIFTPPAIRSKNNVFFNSADNLFRNEKRKLTIPRIEIECDPVFSVQVTDFSEPCPKNVTLTYDESGTNLEINLPNDEDMNKSWKNKTSDFVQKKSYSIEVNEIPNISIDSINDEDKFLSIKARRLRQQRSLSNSLQDVSSSTSSISSCIHESHLDLSQLDGDDVIMPHKNWKSPDELRLKRMSSLDKNNMKAISFPELNIRKGMPNRSQSVSDEKLCDKLTEYERLEILKLLYDWSLHGSESKCDFNFSLRERDQKMSSSEKDTLNDKFNRVNECDLKYKSEPNLSPPRDRYNDKNDFILVTKYSSESNLNREINIDFLHKCEYRNCIFNIDTNIESSTKNHEVTEKSDNKKLKGILKNSREQLNETVCLSNITNLQGKSYRLNRDSRRNSEIIQTKSFNSQLVRCDSLERLTHILRRNRSKDGTHKKFPDSYIIRKNSSRNNSPKSKRNENLNKPKKNFVVQEKHIPKTWKSCSDIKTKKPLTKCCRLAKKSCPLLKSHAEIDRKTQSCVDFDRDSLERAARLAELPDLGAFDRKNAIINVAHNHNFILYDHQSNYMLISGGVKFDEIFQQT